MGPFSIMIAQFGTGRTGRFSDRRLSLLFLVLQRRLHKSVEQGVCVVGTNGRILRHFLQCPRGSPPKAATAPHGRSRPDGYFSSSWCFSAASTNPWNRGCAWSGRMGASRAISFNARGARRPRRQPPRTGGAVPTVISALPGASAPPPQIRGTGGVRGRDGS